MNHEHCIAALQGYCKDKLPRRLGTAWCKLGIVCFPQATADTLQCSQELKVPGSEIRAKNIDQRLSECVRRPDHRGVLMRLPASTSRLQSGISPRLALVVLNSQSVPEPRFGHAAGISLNLPHKCFPPSKFMDICRRLQHQKLYIHGNAGRFWHIPLNAPTNTPPGCLAFCRAAAFTDGVACVLGLDEAGLAAEGCCLELPREAGFDGRACLTPACSLTLR